MARRGTFNGPFFNAFPARVYGTPIKFGILIGSEVQAGQRDLVFAAPTPPQQQTANLEEDPAPAPTPHVKDVVAHLKSKAGSAFVQWVLEHCTSLRKILPAGLEPCGCFVMTSEAVAARDLAPLLAPILKDIPDAVVLSIDARKLTFWQYAGGVKPTLRPAQLKADAHKDALLIWTSTLIDIIVPQPVARDGSDLQAQASAIAGDVHRAVLHSFANCAVGVSAGTSGLRVVDVSSEVPVSGAAATGSSELRASFLRAGSALVVAPNPDGTEAVVRYRVLVSAVLVVMRRDVELRLALGSLRRAIAVSAAQRLQLALEGAATEERGVVMLPWRALCRPKEMDLPFWCGDLCRPDEAMDGARSRLGQLLGLPECAFDEAPSHLDERAQLFKSYGGTYDSAAVARYFPLRASKSEKPGLSLFVCGATVVVLLALTMPFLMRT